MYFTMCFMLTMYFNMAVRHYIVENIRCYIAGHILKHLNITILQENTYAECYVWILGKV